MPNGFMFRDSYSESGAEIEMEFKEGVLRVRKCPGHSLHLYFVRILVKISKKFGPMGGGSNPHIPPWLRPCSESTNGNCITTSLIESINHFNEMAQILFGCSKF